MDISNRDHGEDFRRALRHIVEGNASLVDNKRLRGLINFLEISVYFFADEDSPITFYLSQRLNQCEDIYRARGL